MGRGTKRKSTTTTGASNKNKNNNNDDTNNNDNSDTESPPSKNTRSSSSSGNKNKNNSSSKSKSKMFSSSSKKGKGGSSGGAGNKNNSSSNSKTPQLSSEAAIEKLFMEFADAEDPTIISMEGISKICEPLDIDPVEDIRALVLVWKLVDASSTEKPGQISKTEFCAACSRLGLTSMAKFQSILVPTLDTGFLDQKEFREFYKFCFQFNRQGTHRTLDQDMVLALLPLVFSQQQQSGSRIKTERLETFLAFLEQSGGAPGDVGTYSRITLDQWTSFLDFCYEYDDDDDLSTYDESTSAWPVMMDEYVEYMMKQAANKSNSNNNNNNTTTATSTTTTTTK